MLLVPISWAPYNSLHKKSSTTSIRSIAKVACRSEIIYVGPVDLRSFKFHRPYMRRARPLHYHKNLTTGKYLVYMYSTALLIASLEQLMVRVCYLFQLATVGLISD